MCNFLRRYFCSLFLQCTGRNTLCAAAANPAPASLICYSLHIVSDDLLVPCRFQTSALSDACIVATVYSVLLVCHRYKLCVGSQGMVFDYYVDDATCSMVPWENKVPSFSYMPDNFSSLFVPTVDTTRLTYFLDTLVAKKHYVMFVGNTGTFNGTWLALSITCKQQCSIMVLFGFASFCCPCIWLHANVFTVHRQLARQEHRLCAFHTPIGACC